MHTACRFRQLTAVKISTIIFALIGTLLLPWTLFAACPLSVDGNRVIAETSTLSAVIDGGRLVSIIRKADNRQMLAGGQGPAIQLIYAQGDEVALGESPGDLVHCLQLTDNLVHLRIESWNGDALLAISTDPQNGDLVVEPSAYSSRPGLRSCRWNITAVDEGLELVAPFFQGIKMPLEDPLIAGQGFDWPHAWEAGLAILQGEAGGFWVHCRDNRYHYKNLRVGLPDSPRSLGFESEAWGPLDENLGAGGLAWRINVYQGDWQVPAAQYRQWLASAYELDNQTRPEWIDSLRLAISWTPSDPELLDALAARVNPRTVLLHVPFWRTDEYDQNYPSFKASQEGADFIRKTQAMGFRAMPHFNSIDMDPTHPAYPYVRDFEFRQLTSGRLQGWSWVDSRVLGVPESNAMRNRHRAENVMVKIHPGLAMWRSILAENVQGAVRELDLGLAFLDVTLCCWNIRNAVVENLSPAEGMKRLEALIGALKPGLVVGGEGRNEITMQDQQLSQVHLFRSWQENTEGMQRLKTVPLSEFLFGRWSRSFGYSGLSGETPESQLRIALHASLNTIPTLTVNGAEEIIKPNPALEDILRQAGK